MPPLSSLTPPNIPFSFLLSGPLFEKQFTQALQNVGACVTPWRKGYGKLFWSYYVRQGQSSTKDLWRALVPLSYEVAVRVTPDRPDEKARARVYLYPWGIGLVLDISASGEWDLAQAVTLALAIRKSRQFHLELNGTSKDVALNGLVDSILDHVRSACYGNGAAKGQKGELFSVVTVLDGTGVDPTQPIAGGSKTHQALDALVGWSALWESIQPGPIAGSTIAIKQSPPGHIVYGGRRGRVVWFPGSFVSVAAYEHTLSCYHQNLTMASLQTESLCRMAKDAADLLINNQPLSDYSVAYRTCAQLAAGILGRLYGGTFDTYRSHSVRDQIERMYKNYVIALRTGLGMGTLKP